MKHFQLSLLREKSKKSTLYLTHWSKGIGVLLTASFAERKCHFLIFWIIRKWESRDTSRKGVAKGEWPARSRVMSRDPRGSGTRDHEISGATERGSTPKKQPKDKCKRVKHLLPLLCCLVNLQALEDLGHPTCKGKRKDTLSPFPRPTPSQHPFSKAGVQQSDALRLRKFQSLSSIRRAQDSQHNRQTQTQTHRKISSRLA